MDGPYANIKPDWNAKKSEGVQKNKQLVKVLGGIQNTYISRSSLTGEGTNRNNTNIRFPKHVPES